MTAAFFTLALCQQRQPEQKAVLIVWERLKRFNIQSQETGNFPGN